MTDLQVIDGDSQPEPAEPYITRKELAARMGVSLRTIDYLVAQGMPSETWGIRSRRFLATRAITWARARGYERTAA